LENLFKNELREELTKLVNNLRELRKFCRNELQENELQDYILRFGEFNYLIDSFLELKDEDKNYVYWVELTSQKPDANVSLCASPVDLSEFFRDNIFRDNNSCIMTSATLTVNNNFKYFTITLDPKYSLPAIYLFPPVSYYDAGHSRLTGFHQFCLS